MVIWRNADTTVMEFPSAVVGHGWTLEDGVITLLWNEGDCLPTLMVDESILEDKRAGISDVAEEVEEMCLYQSDPDE